MATSGDPAAASAGAGGGEFAYQAATPGEPTGTFVGERVVALRGDLDRLRNQLSVHNADLQDLRARVATDSERYHGTVAAINARLQIGTTPGNPVLVQQFASAESDLDRLAADVGALNELANSVAGDARLAAYIAESTRAAFAVSGAVDEDHRQLAILQDEVDQTTVLVDRLVTELSDEIRRQSEFVSAERGNLNSLAAGVRAGQIFGGSLMNQAVGGRAAAPKRATSSRRAAAQRPLVVVRFDRANVQYQQSLFAAVDQALNRRPNARFDLIGVAPADAEPGRVAVDTTKARRQADAVARSLVDMGLPPDRVLVSTATSDTAQTNEVRVYIR